MPTFHLLLLATALSGRAVAASSAADAAHVRDAVAMR